MATTLFRKPAAPLVQQLAAKTEELRATEGDKHNLGLHLSTQAQHAFAASATAAVQADAVERALDIIEKAGVTL